MSVKTDALEVAVTELIQARNAMEAAPGARRRALANRAFAALLRLIAPRIRYFIARYGLGDMREDAEQACAIALHRAVALYDPAQAKFTTFINWQLRGELQSLRFRVRTDSRGSAKRVDAATLSFSALTAADGTPFEQLIPDDEAEARTASGAADMMARRAAERLIDHWQADCRTRALEQAAARRRCCPGTVHPDDVDAIEAKLARERRILNDHLCGGEGEDAHRALTARAREADRPVLRRALREIGLVAVTNRALAVRPPSHLH